MKCVSVAFSVIFFLLPLQVHAKGTAIILAGRHVSVWSPIEGTPLPAPIILFSHGFHGCADQSTFLTEALTAEGYWVFAPEHLDSSCIENGSTGRPDKSFGAPESWDDQTYINRRDDMKAVLEALQESPDFAGKIDFLKVGLAGHSLGGYTVLGLAGAWESWTMDNVKAVLALSPLSSPYNVHYTLSGLTAPVMYQGGTRDMGITRFIKKPDDGSYDQSPAPKYYAELDGAAHFAWADVNPAHHAEINAMAIAFLNTYIKGAPPRAVLTEKGQSLAALWYDTGAAQGRFEDSKGPIRDRIRDRVKGRFQDSTGESN